MLALLADYGIVFLQLEQYSMLQAGARQCMEKLSGLAVAPGHDSMQGHIMLRMSMLGRRSSCPSLASEP